jgi:hypothetical protein
MAGRPRKMNKRDPLKGNVPKDLDGAFRVLNRLDKKTEAQLRGKEDQS